MFTRVFRTIFVTAVCIALLEGFGYLALHNLDRTDPINYVFPHRFMRLKKVLAHDEGALPRYISAVNLNYMPTPGYKISGREEHNKDGYRGDAVPLEKGNKFRILFLGGSTTYGSLVIDYHDSYPAQTIHWLNILLAQSKKKLKTYEGFEGINAGMEGDYSCDELNLYLHKFRYYKPDLLVYHSVGNDAELDFNNNSYTPDMVNLRTPEMYQIYRYAIPPFLFRSYFFSYVAIRFFLMDKFNHDQPRMQPSLDIPCNWFTDKARTEMLLSKHKEGPFYYNTRTLINEANLDSVQVLLVPWALNMRDKQAYGRPQYVETVKIYNDMLKDFYQKYHTLWMDYTYEMINKDYWVDDCHLTKEGESQKGKLAATAILDYLISSGEAIDL